MSWMERLTGWMRPASGEISQFDVTLEDARRARCSGDPQVALDHAERARGLAVYGEQTSDADFERIRALIMLRRYDEARAALEKMERDAHTTRSRTQVGIAHGELAEAGGDLNEARTHYESAVAATRSASGIGFGDVAALARGLLASVALRDGGARYAEHLLREALAMFPPEIDRGLRGWLTGLRGEAAFGNGQPAEAQMLLEQALTLSGAAGCRADARRWATLLGDKAIADGRTEDAHNAYFRALSLYPPNTVSPDYVDTVLGMSRTALEFRDPKTQEEALSYAQIGLRVAEQLGDAPRTAWAHGAMGEALRALGRSEDAIPHLRASLEDGDHAPVSARRALAAALIESGDTQTAISVYEDAVKRADQAGVALERANVRRDLGLARWRNGDYAGAIQVWTAAIPLYEESNATAQVARLYCDIANARRGAGGRARAVKDIEQALMLLGSLDREDTETRGAVLANAAMIYAEGSDAESADSFFKEAVELAAAINDPVAQATRLGNYGWFLLLVGRPRRAQATLEQALSVSRTNKLSLQIAVQTDNLGLVHDALGEFPRALELHQEALTLTDDPYWRVFFNANTATTLTSLGRHDEALTCAETALDSARAGSSPENTVAALLAKARVLIALNRLDDSAVLLDEAVATARKIDQRRLLAEALAERSRLEARRGQRDSATAAWEEAKKLYLLLHMPQGKISPDWL